MPDNTVLTYYNSEQYMMHRKAMLFEDYTTAAQIMAAPNDDPKECKRLGRLIRNFEQKKWNENAIDIVTEGCFHKFSQHKTLGDQLLATDNRPIAEASPYDRVWGIGLCENAAQTTPPAEWPGTNWLGTCLERVRAMLLRNNTE